MLLLAAVSGQPDTSTVLFPETAAIPANARLLAPELRLPVDLERHRPHHHSVGRLCGIDSASPETCVVVRSGPDGGKATTAQSCGQVSGGRRVRRDSSRRRRRRRRIPGWLPVNVAASNVLLDSRFLVGPLGKAPLEESEPRNRLQRKQSRSSRAAAPMSASRSHTHNLLVLRLAVCRSDKRVGPVLSCTCIDASETAGKVEMSNEIIRSLTTQRNPFLPEIPWAWQSETRQKFRVAGKRWVEIGAKTLGGDEQQSDTQVHRTGRKTMHESVLQGQVVTRGFARAVNEGAKRASLDEVRAGVAPRLPRCRNLLGSPLFP
ncbi:hypothetical protein CMUS01_00420 [Colletotrichum musicola]|uniref:Uncharacterized protein n=1 Tax=Colletotrichum musicola TaxID=2175873 RepID=A0A8H6NYW3_9PEZI|nr:hypothetical protein CMUS01_00420 [Colletotrichum musicola]